MKSQITDNQSFTEKSELHSSQSLQTQIPLKPKQLFSELTKHLCSDFQPSKYLNQLLSAGNFDEYPFTMLKILETIPQSPIHHPEGCVWNHVSLVVDYGAQVRQLSRDPIVFMWAALLHDLGKAKTTRERRGRITAYEHDAVGMDMAVEFLSELTEDQILIKQVSMLVKYHMHPLYILKKLPFGNLQAMKADTDVREIALLGFCDRMGRTGSNGEEENRIINDFLKKCGIKNSPLSLFSHINHR